METKEESTGKDCYVAHVDYATQRQQSAREHLQNVADFAKSICPLPGLEAMIELIAVLHDAGKLAEENQQDFHNILKSGDQAHRHDLDHSTGGGRIAQELIEGEATAELVSNVIYFHHGLSDCIKMENGVSLQEERKQKNLDYKSIKERFFRIYDLETLKEKSKRAVKEYCSINHNIVKFVKKCESEKTHCGDGYFFWGMYQRVLLSLLIDADWTDTACFFQDIPLKKRRSMQETEEVWEQCIKNFEEYMGEHIRKNPEKGSTLNTWRQEISDACQKAADTDNNLYRLTVPTGAGKTLSSLRFALYHAAKKKKQHIIYVAPFNVLLEQNAEEIRKAIKNPEVVLEHHCNVVCEDGEEERYRDLTETWDVPIIVTTAVQVLNTLFSNQKGYIRRMHTLCNSVIIFDEVQAIPSRCIELFHEAVNFLTQFANTTVVLCSATQPSVAALKENNVYTCTEMAEDIKQYTEAFKRTNIVDATKDYRGGMSIEDLKKFTIEKAEMHNNALVIVNTTKCAFELFQALKREELQEYKLFHLSNNMCPQNKLDVLNEVRERLKCKEKVICVSTQVVEAGVDFSFGCVIRSKAGLDNVIQAAGRCNRHKEFEKFGTVYIIQLEAENLEKLQEIRQTQKALQKVLDDFGSCPELFDGTLDSQKAVRAYYGNYFQESKTKFYCECKGCSTTLDDLLGKNKEGRNQYKRYYKKKLSIHSFAQAFVTAGTIFAVIEENYKTNIIVPYNDEARELIGELVSDHQDLSEQKQILRKLQRYTVGISEYRKKNLGSALKTVTEGQILVLCDGYYDKETGVSEEMIAENSEAFIL